MFNIINKTIRLFRKVIIKYARLNLIKSNHIDLRLSAIEITPLNILNLTSTLESKFILNIPTDKIIYSELMANWIKTLQYYKNEKRTSSINKNSQSYEFFKKYFDDFQPKNVEEYLNITLNNSSSSISKSYLLSSPLHAVMPWSNQTPSERILFVEEFTKKEFEQYSKSTYNKQDGNKFFGPCSYRFIDVEYRRLTENYNKILDNGYIEKLGLIEVKLIFTNGNQYMIEQGNGSHRTAILISMGLDEIPMLISNKTIKVIKREESHIWPNVRNGLYTQEQALQLFDLKFNSLRQKSIN